MKKLSLLSTLLTACLCLASCAEKGEKLSASQIEEKFGKSVVLVQNQYFYSTNFGDLTIYFTGIDEDGELDDVAVDESDITMVTSYGTGFFVSADGKIATNSHVANPAIDMQEVRSNISNIKAAVETVYDNAVSATNDSINMMQNYWMNAPSGSALEAQIEYERDRLINQRDQLQEMASRIRNVDISNIEINIHAKIGIAYNNTFITNTTDFKECVLVKDDDEHDVAVIQLKDKKTPEDCHPFTVAKAAAKSDSVPHDAEGNPIDIDKLALGTKLYLIGYNLGPALALTKDGVKAQITEGTLSQNTDDVKMMYTIPTLHGSSGAPVVDEYGNFVGINFAGIGSTQNFNYGVKAKYLRKLLGLD